MIKSIKSNIRRLLKKTINIIIKDDIIRKKIIVKFYNFKNININSKYKYYDIFDYKNIIKNRRHICYETYRGNSFYGIGPVLRKFALYDKPINACIEHGVYFGDYVNPQETYETNMPAVLTFSKNRKKHIRKLCSKPVFCIGPYINYAELAYEDIEIDKIKDQFGKTLLVFPAHSIDRVDSKFDLEEFMDYIEALKSRDNFKTILVCLYWKDIELNRDIPYLNRGFKVITAGHRNDPEFLSRLKTFITISDYTISNSVGTHVGYCISLGKPHHIFEQKKDYVGYTGNDTNDELLNTESNIRSLEIKEVLDAFSEYSHYITENQKYICNKYWGIDDIKNHKEIRLILEYCNNKSQKIIYENNDIVDEAII